MSNPNKTFVHLHVHSEFSLLDGLSRVKKLVSRAKELEMPAVSLTDHGVMFGVMDFYNAAKSEDVKPIIGMESYIAPRGMEDRDAKLDRTPFHMLLLAKNQTGYQNLLKISSEGQIRGYYYRPRVDWEFLQAHSEGLVATSGCLAAKIPRMIQEGKDDEAKEWIGRMTEIFGEENFYLELQEHDIDLQRELNKWLIDYNRTNHTNVGLLATTDLHYVRESDFDIHDTLLCIQTGSLKSETDRLTFSDNSFYMSSYDEMMAMFKEVPEAVHNSVKIAEMCDLNLDREEYHLPVFPVPEGFDSTSYLRHLCEIGMDWRFGDRKNEKVLRDRLNRELDIINNMGFNTYFLIVWDLCEFARHADIWWNVRGSGAGSLAAYCLGITNIDPIQNALLFERFLNPGRVSMPDIDLDYPDDRRGEMIAYTASKYGEDKVAAIITFGTMGAKAAVRDVGRALDVPLPDVNRAAGLIPQEAKQKSLEAYVETIPDLKRIYDQEPAIKQIIDVAKELQGISRHASTHAAGVIIADRPLVEYLPLHRITGKDPSGGALKAVTQFPMETCEAIGLLKVDFLGLSTLTILRKAADLIEKHRGIKYTMDNIPYRHDDPKVTDEQRKMLDVAFEMMGRGETVGVFQLESSGMQQMLRGMRPKVFENIIAGISLYRPGPMEFIPQYNRRLHEEEETVFRHEKLAPILKETYGIMVYQEQLMQVAGDLFGYDLGEADLMRRAVSKKKAKDLQKHREIFLERGPENGIDEDTAGKIFDDIEFFANYGFNKCLVGDTEIVDADTGRLVKLGDLYSGYETVKQTFTCDTDTRLLKRGAITDVISNGLKPVYLLKTETGRRIKATSNHPFFVKAEHWETKGGWRTLGDLRDGLNGKSDVFWAPKIAVPRYLSVNGSDEWDEIDLRTLVDLAVKRSHWFFENQIERGTLDNERTQSYLQLKEKVSLDEVHLGLPREIFQLSNESLKQLVAWSWWQIGDVNRKYNGVYFSFEHPGSAFDYQHILLRFGIISSVHECDVQSNGVHRTTLTISGHLDVLRFIRCFDNAIRKNQRHITHGWEKFEDLHKIKHQLSSLDPTSALEIDDEPQHIYWDRVVSIELAGEEQTYDLTIDGTYNFIANDILVHNSHASDYAVITVQTAYLKAHYPEEFMTALLSVQRDDSTKVATFLEECRRLTIPVLPPDVNYSMLDFDIQKDPDSAKRAIRFGMAAIKNAGASALQHIIDARVEGGRFSDLTDFCKRVDLRHVGKRALESLIKVGALNSFGNRATLYNALERILAYSADYHKDQEVGQMNMFGETMGMDSALLSNIPNAQEFNVREMLQWEKELLGLYVTGRPVDKFRESLAQTTSSDVSELKRDAPMYNGKEVGIAGEIVQLRKIYTRNNEAMAVAHIEDWHDTAGTIEVVLFPRTWAKVQDWVESGELHSFEVGEVVMIGGKFDNSRGDPQIIAETVRKDFETMATSGSTTRYDNSAPDWARDDSTLPSSAQEPPAWGQDDDLYDEETGEVAEDTERAVDPEPVDVSVPTTQDGTVVPDPKPAPVTAPPVENGTNGNASNHEPAENGTIDYGPPPVWSQGVDDLEVEPMDAVEEASQMWLRVYFRRSGDDHQDRRRLKRLHNLIVSYPGTDRFSIIVEGRNRADTIEFPNDTTGFCQDLVDDLLTIVEDVQNIEVWNEKGRVELTPDKKSS